MIKKQHNKIELISNGDLQEMLNANDVKKVAIDLGVTPQGVYKSLLKRKAKSKKMWIIP